MLTPSFGANAGTVYICDGSSTVVLSPDSARGLAQHLPRIADWADVLAAAEPPAPTQQEIGRMARRLAGADWKWFPHHANRNCGFWGRYNPTTSRFTKTDTTDYRSATMQAHALESRP